MQLIKNILIKDFNNKARNQNDINKSRVKWKRHSKLNTRQ